MKITTATFVSNRTKQIMYLILKVPEPIAPPSVINKPIDENIVHHGSPNAETKPNDNSASQNGLGQEFQDILNNQQNGQGDSNTVQVPTQPSIVQGGNNNVPSPTLVQGGDKNVPSPTLVDGGANVTPNVAPVEPQSDADEAGAEFGLDVNKIFFFNFNLFSITIQFSSNR